MPCRNIFQGPRWRAKQWFGVFLQYQQVNWKEKSRHNERNDWQVNVLPFLVMSTCFTFISVSTCIHCINNLRWYLDVFLFYTAVFSKALWSISLVSDVRTQQHVGICDLGFDLDFKSSTFRHWDQTRCNIEVKSWWIKAAVFKSKAEKCGPGRCMEAAILSRRSRVTTGNDTLMVADGLGMSAMEEDWPDNTDEADRSISHPTAYLERPLTTLHSPYPPPPLPSAPPKTRDFINLLQQQQQWAP